MSVLSPGLLGAVGLVLVVAGTGHLRRPVDLRTGLARHGVVPGWALHPVRWGLPPLELALGLLVLLAAVGTVPAAWPALATALLSATFTAYLWTVLRRHPGEEVPCACGLGSTPVTGTSVARAALLALFAVTGGLTADAWAIADRPWYEVLVAVSAAAVLALATAALPATRAVPQRPHLSALSGVSR